MIKKIMSFVILRAIVKGAYGEYLAPVNGYNQEENAAKAGAMAAEMVTSMFRALSQSSK